MNKHILIVGGYGAVGSIISKVLAQQFPGKVMVAGRSLQKAQQLAKALKDQVIPVQLDLSAPPDAALLGNVGFVIMCIDQEDARFAAWCIDRGIDYIDITASGQLIAQMEKLHARAKSKNVRVVLSVGLAPGITNLLAQHGLQQLPGGSQVDISILLGLGEKHGDAAYRWTFDNLHSHYDLVRKSQPAQVSSFSLPRRSVLAGYRRFYTFNFSDQHTLLQTTTASEVVTRMAFDSKALTRLIAALRTTGLTRLFRSKRLQRILIPLFKRSGIGSDIFGARAEVMNGDMFYSSSILGHGEGKVTAYFAAELALYLLKSEWPGGVWHSHQLVKDIPAFLQRLKKYDGKLEINL